MLYELIARKNRKSSQKNITKYIKNNKDRYPTIGFRKSRKADYDEDYLTYLRNEIGHCEDTNDFELYATLGNQISDEVIKLIIKVLNDLILDLPISG